MPKRPTTDAYVEFDHDHDMYGVFCSETGFCFHLAYTEEDAYDYMNSRVFPSVD